MLNLNVFICSILINFLVLHDFKQISEFIEKTFPDKVDKNLQAQPFNIQSTMLSPPSQFDMSQLNPVLASINKHNEESLKIDDLDELDRQYFGDHK